MYLFDKDLWEFEHSYYCNEGNYFNNDCGKKYKSWQDFHVEMGDSDLDMNLLFRWDWTEKDPETGECTYNGDDNYRNGTLKIFWMCQRKGLYLYSLISVCRSDASNVRIFLFERWNHLQLMWRPISYNPS